MKTGDRSQVDPTDTNRSGDALRVVDLAGSIYSAHIHHGRAYLNPGDAVKTAACIIGMARSDTAHDLIAKSSADVAGAEQFMAAIRHRAAVQVEKDRDVAIEKFAQILSGGGEVLERKSAEPKV